MGIAFSTNPADLQRNIVEKIEYRANPDSYSFAYRDFAAGDLDWKPPEKGNVTLASLLKKEKPDAFKTMCDRMIGASGG